jgi:putative membrane protein
VAGRPLPRRNEIGVRGAPPTRGASEGSPHGVNAVVRPIAFVLTLPLTLVTLGLFLFVLNAAMFALVAAMLDNFIVSGFWSALFGAIIVSITSTIASWYIGPDGRVEVIVVTRR